ncbi:MAG TPA: alkyl hydroperoxide reductase subunit F, partial [Acidocella sp.]|nr:alkyl hydroperoxide reductase subunit F [Acidocella sp.]
MLDDGLKAQLKTYLANVVKPVELVATLDSGPKSQELLALLTDVAAQSDKVSLRTDGQNARIPSFD